MSEKIDLQQEALNALKDAGLGSNSLRQAEEHVAAVTMSGRMRSIFHLEESVDILPRMNAGDSRILRFGFLFATTKQERRGR